MISCPICQKNVLRLQNDFLYPSDPPQSLQDDDINDFCCPTYAHILGNLSWHHYRRQTKENYQEYTAHLPPFRLIWNSNNYLIVARLNILNSLNNFAFDKIWDSQNADLSTFLHQIQRFKILIPFS